MSIRTLTTEGAAYAVRRATMSHIDRINEERAYWLVVDATEGTCEWQYGASTEHTITSEADALSAGTAHQTAWHQHQTDKREAHAWNTIGHVESCQPYATLAALACLQQVDHYSPDTGTWSTEYLTLTRTGRPTTTKYNDTRKSAGRAGGKASSRALRSDGRPMTQAERKAESKANGAWRKVASEAGYFCPEHGPVGKRCKTLCRKAALALTETTEPVAVAEAAGRGW